METFFSSKGTAESTSVSVCLSPRPLLKKWLTLRRNNIGRIVYSPSHSSPQTHFSRTQEFRICAETHMLQPCLKFHVFSHTNLSVLPVLTPGLTSLPVLFPCAGAVKTTVSLLAVDVSPTRNTSEVQSLFPVRTAVWRREIGMESATAWGMCLYKVPPFRGSEKKLEGNKKHHWGKCSGAQSSETRSPNWYTLRLLSDSFSDTSDANPSQNKYCVTQGHQRLKEK